MDSLTLFVAGIALAFWGGYAVAKRFPQVGALFAVALLGGAWLLVRLDLGASSLGDGAPSSAGAFLGLLIALAWLCILLSAVMLVTAWLAHRHALSKALLIFLLLPFACYAAFNAWPKPRQAPSSTTPANAPVPLGAKGSKMDGYIWAVDAQFLSESECQGASQEFIAGCKEGVAKNRSRQLQ